jgi:hypothetical protein
LPRPRTTSLYPYFSHQFHPPSVSAASQQKFLHPGLKYSFSDLPSYRLNSALIHEFFVNDSAPSFHLKLLAQRSAVIEPRVDTIPTSMRTTSRSRPLTLSEAMSQTGYWITSIAGCLAAFRRSCCCLDVSNVPCSWIVLIDSI